MSSIICKKRSTEKSSDQFITQEETGPNKMLNKIQLVDLTVNGKSV